LAGAVVARSPPPAFLCLVESCFFYRGGKIRLPDEVRRLPRVHPLLPQRLGHVGEREHEPPVAPSRAAARRAPARCRSRALLLRGGAALARSVWFCVVCDGGMSVFESCLRKNKRKRGRRARRRQRRQRLRAGREKDARALAPAAREGKKALNCNESSITVVRNICVARPSRRTLC
jgi:hypothetical protein